MENSTYSYNWYTQSSRRMTEKALMNLTVNNTLKVKGLLCRHTSMPSQKGKTFTAFNDLDIYLHIQTAHQDYCDSVSPTACQMASHSPLTAV